MKTPRRVSFDDIARDWDKNHPVPANDSSVPTFSKFVKLCVRQTKSGKSLSAVTGGKAMRPVKTMPIARRARVELEKN